MSARNNPIRRSQLIAPFGVGAMVVVEGGVGLLTAGLDHWYKREDGTGGVIEDEYIIEEWRMQRLLQVDHFRLPPDYRAPWRYDSSTPNVDLTIPFLRFPRWHFCPRCDRLYKRPLSERGRPKCQECNKDLYQVPFVTICKDGHLQDFPWREWVHGEKAPTCNGVLRLKATGSATLSGQRVSCDECKKTRNLSHITTASPDGSTYLSQHLADDGSVFYCPGHLTWLGEGVRQECTAHLRGSLRSAANVYFAHVRSSIYLPRGTHAVPDELIRLFSNPPISTQLRVLVGVLGGPEHLERAVEAVTADSRYATKFENYSMDQRLEAAKIAFSGHPQGNIEDTFDDTFMIEEDFRREEYTILQQSTDEELLRIRPAPLHEYDSDIAQYFSKVMLVDKLQETRVLTGFSRVFATNEQSLAERKAMLRKPSPDTSGSNWLPAYQVYGEGIFFEFDEEQLLRWEQQPEIISRIQQLDRRYREVQQNRRLEEQEITPRLVLLHTFAHVLMNHLTFECGYSSAALREKLYVSNDPTHTMSGVLVYTADGDAEGTMGGLVRMGKQGYIEPVIRRAVQDATWCSVDPVCTEVGGRGGQGPDSCNLAACHNCALVPETACEHFNRFLDRVMLVGDIDNPSLGYFKVR